MRIPLFSFPWFFMVAAAALAQDAANPDSAPPASEFERTLRENYQKAADAANDEASKKAAALRTTYELRLENLANELVAGGKTVEAAPVQAELQRLTKNEPLLDEQVSAANAGRIREARKQYHGALETIHKDRDKRLRDLAEIGHKALEDHARGLEQSGKKEEAAHIQKSLAAWKAESAPPASASSSDAILVAKSVEANKGVEKRLSDAVAFDGPPGDGRKGAKGILIKAAPSNAGSTWAFQLTWRTGSFETHIIHPAGNGQAIVHLGESTAALSTPKSWAEVGYRGPADSLRLSREAAQIFPLRDQTEYQVVSRLNANGSYELFLNGTLVATGRATSGPPLDLEISMEKKFPGASGWAELKFTGIDRDDLPLKWSPGWAGVMAGPSDAGQYTSCARVTYYTTAADIARKGP